MESNLELFKHSVEIQVRFNDVDILGHVSNTVYQTYYDYGKLGYFDEVLGDIDWKNLALVGASIKIDYLKPIYLKSKVVVKTRVAVIGHKSLTFQHCIVDKFTNEILSTCTAVLVCYAPQEERSVLVPDVWRKNIMEYEPDVLIKE